MLDVGFGSGFPLLGHAFLRDHQWPSLLHRQVHAQPRRAPWLARYVARAQALGDPAELISIPGASHFDLTDPLSFAWPTVRDSVIRSVTPFGPARG